MKIEPKTYALALLLASSICQPVKAVDPDPTPVVATHYFYWYHWPDQHFNQPGAMVQQGHYHTLPDRESVSYLDEKWHAQQLRSMAESGIDIALPVYWGAPGAYGHEKCRFSVAGLPPMIAAAQKLGEHSPKLGLFYDTSSLLNIFRGAEPSSGRPDLTTPDGREIFCRTVTEYFERIPSALWGRVDNRPLVVLYASAFAARWDETLGSHLRTAFAARFPGENVFLVSDVSWGDIGQDRTTGWGAALNGPRLFPGVAQIGAGYNDTPVPGSKTPTREREDGNYYRNSWQAALAHNPELVLIETWNEMHEGTEICRTLETGDLYLDLTSEWIQKFKKAQDPGPAISLRWPLPRARPDLSWGEEAAGKTTLQVDYSSAGSQIGGIRQRSWEDGPAERIDGAVRSPVSQTWDPRYLYFQVSDHWALEVAKSKNRTLLLEIRTATPTALQVEYDSHDRSATLEGSYTPAPRIDPPPQKPATANQTFRLPNIYFANRQNGASDFRLVLHGSSPVDVTSVTLRPETPPQ